ncbi:hypothetical protein U8016_002598 [Vibrio parahaemolyticus]|nr:hypothetical protein [Vibrio parahaemolyticus]
MHCDKEIANFCIVWPDFFSSELTPISTDAEFYIQWPSFFEYEEYSDDGANELCIQWPKYFSCSIERSEDNHQITWSNHLQQKKPENGSSENFLIKWPVFFDLKIGISDSDEELLIQWPEFILPEIKTLIDSLPINESMEPKQTRLLSQANSTPTSTRSSYDHSYNLSGLQFVSGHYRRLKNGSVVYVKPHRRIR